MSRRLDKYDGYLDAGIDLGTPAIMWLCRIVLLPLALLGYAVRRWDN